MTVEVIEQGDLFASGADALVCPVNCLGVHGKGLAKEFAKRYPVACKAYTTRCQSEDTAIEPGCVHWEPPDVLPRQPAPYRAPLWIVFFTTKDHWRTPSTLAFVDRGLRHLCTDLRISALRVESIAVPALGAGLGGLDWKDVLPGIEAAANAPDMQRIRWMIYAPHEAG
jgi:O-acetyl-ADP-ribose deacetylase (regulator of RNase III)